MTQPSNGTIQISDRSHHATLVLKHAQACEIPAPKTVTVRDDQDHISVFTKTLEDLTVWSHWLNQPIEHHCADMYFVFGEVLDAPIHVHYEADPLESIDGKTLFDSGAAVA